MRCFDQEPKDWKDLQNLTGQLFSEIGCTVRVTHRVKLVRGEKEVDVVVEDPVSAPASYYLCECKLWSEAVPQEVVHGFRTVVADFGAHRGFIISKKGFQAGAHKAAENTNISLVTFSELQEVFFDRWRRAMGEKYLPVGDKLFPYWDPTGGKRPPRNWGDEHRRQLVLLNEAYAPLIKLGPQLKSADFKWALPIKLPKLDASGRIVGEITLKTYREVYDFIESNKEVAFTQYDALFAEKLIIGR